MLIAKAVIKPDISDPSQTRVPYHAHLLVQSSIQRCVYKGSIVGVQGEATTYLSMPTPIHWLVHETILLIILQEPDLLKENDK